jgi:hypothetical protein
VQVKQEASRQKRQDTKEFIDRSGWQEVTFGWLMEWPDMGNAKISIAMYHEVPSS